MLGAWYHERTMGMIKGLSAHVPAKHGTACLGLTS